MKILSIIIPVYNEKETVLELLRRVQAVDFSKNNPEFTGSGGLEKEIIIVDDGSTDGTVELLKTLTDAEKKETLTDSSATPHESVFSSPLKPALTMVFKEKNEGKGAALKRGFQQATGEIIAVQDADLEYNPQDLPKLVRPILDNKTEIVYGSRFFKKKYHRYRLYYFANLLIVFLFRLLYGVKITDPATCYKLFRRAILSKIPPLRSNGFEMEPEFTAKVIRTGYKILELPVEYYGRTFSEGKKIKWRHALKYFWAIIKFRF